MAKTRVLYIFPGYYDADQGGGFNSGLFSLLEKGGFFDSVELHVAGMGYGENCAETMDRFRRILGPHRVHSLMGVARKDIELEKLVRQVAPDTILESHETASQYPHIKRITFHHTRGPKRFYRGMAGQMLRRPAHAAFSDGRSTLNSWRNFDRHGVYKPSYEVPFIILEPHERVLRKSPPTFQMLSIGRLVTPKNFHLLIRATAKLINEEKVKMHLTIAGDGRQYQALTQLAKDLGIENHVTLTGYVEGREKQRLFDRANAFISASRDEGLAIAPLEAMAQGIPTIVVGRWARGGWANESNVLFTDTTVDGLVASMRRMISEYDRVAPGLRDHGLQTIQRGFTKEGVQPKYRLAQWEMRRPLKRNKPVNASRPKTTQHTKPTFGRHKELGS